MDLKDFRKYFKLTLEVPVKQWYNHYKTKVLKKNSSGGTLLWLTKLMQILA